MFVVINNENIVTDVFESNPNFHKDITVIETSDSLVEVNYLYNQESGTFAKQEIPAIEGSDYIALLSEARYNKEISGVEYKGMTISTNRDSQSALASAYIYGLQNPDATISWKCDNGYIELSMQDITELSSLFRQHIQECFDKEAEILTHINEGTFSESMLQNW